MPLKRSTLVLAFLSVLTLSGCAALQNLFKSAFQRPTFTFKTARLGAASFSDATVNLVWAVKNPNPFGLSLASVDYQFFVEGKQVVAGRPPTGLKIAASKTSEVVFPASVKFRDIAPVLETFLNKDTAAYRAQGTVGIQTPIGVLKFPLSRSGSFEVPKPPQVQLAAPRVTQMGISGATVEFPLTVTNRNSFALPISGLAGALKIAGANVGNLSTGDLGTLAARSPRQLTLPLKINFAQAASAAAALRGGTANVSFLGEVLSGSSAVPMSFSQNLTFQK